MKTWFSMKTQTPHIWRRRHENKTKKNLAKRCSQSRRKWKKGMYFELPWKGVLKTIVFIQFKDEMKRQRWEHRHVSIMSAVCTGKMVYSARHHLHIERVYVSADRWCLMSVRARIFLLFLFTNNLRLRSADERRCVFAYAQTIYTTTILHTKKIWTRRKKRKWKKLTCRKS